MQLTMLDLMPENAQRSSAGKTSPESYPPKITPSGVSLPGWLARLPHSFRAEDSGGRTQVWLLDPAEQSRGGPSMPNISVWPNDAAVCSLSQVLEDSAPSRFYLSPKACAGILRRAEARGRELPEPLRLALEQAAMTLARTERPAGT